MHGSTAPRHDTDGALQNDPILAVGPLEDVFLATFVEQLRQTTSRVVHLTENEFFESTSLTCERAGLLTRGTVCLGGTRVDIDSLGGIVLRLERRWSPSHDFDLQDQLFVYHETMAAWFALLDLAKCPVINRFGLGWWLHDVWHGLALALEINETLGIRDRAPFANRDRSNEIHRLYRVGNVSVPASGCAAEVVDFVKEHETPLRRWATANRLSMYRLDCAPPPDPRVLNVDPCPAFTSEPRELTADVAAHLVAFMEVREDALA